MAADPRRKATAGLLTAGVILVSLLAVQRRLPGRPTSNASSQPPPTRRVEVTEILFGHRITDPYRWLEDQRSADTRAWIDRQEKYARALLDPIRQRVAIEKRIRDLLDYDSVSMPLARGGRYFYLRRKKGEQLYKICVRHSLHGNDEVLVDPVPLSPDLSASVRIEGVSHDGKLLAYSIQHGGEDASNVRILDAEQRRDLPDVLPTNYYGRIYFTRDGRGFFYSRYGTEGPRIFYHQLGTEPRLDALIFGEGIGPELTAGASLSDDGRYLVIEVGHGWTSNDVYLKNVAEDGPVVKLVAGVDARFAVEVGGDHLFVHTNWKAPRGRILVGDLTDPAFERWRELIPQGKNTIEGFSLAGGKLFVRYLEDAVPHIRIFSSEGQRAGEIRFPGIGSTSYVDGRWASSEAFFTYQSFNTPETIYRYDAPPGERSVWKRVQIPFDGQPYEVKEAWYTSKDGTRAPIFVVYRKATKLDGSNPTLLHGYGGFNVAMTPEFSTRAALWLESGGVYALAILRGGGEFGEEWHRAGMLANKQHVFDDFIAASEWLIKAGYTTPQKLVINGASNGGLLVGAALTQRPDLYRVVICRKPDLDMLRRHIGAHNVYATLEYGSANKPDQFGFLYGYSPYESVKRGTSYPAVLLTSGDADQRVQPFQALKMTAALQWATTSRNPVVLLYDRNAGHNGGSTLNQDVSELADEVSFIFWQLGMRR